LSHEQGNVARLTGATSDNAKLAEELYLTFYSRFPTASERRNAEKYLNECGSNRRHATEDLAWSMLNSIEFVFNH
jgi:hypothetical protein